MLTAAVITVSDKGYAGERADGSGPLLMGLLADAGYAVRGVEIVPDERALIEEALIRCADEYQVNLVATTGGTGFAARDVTPEATIAVCSRLCPGIPEAMRFYSLQKTNRAMLSRAAAGIRGKTLIVNLPGSPRAVRENLEPILPALEHGLAMLLGTGSECAANIK